ncbi:uncharacterized protein LOC135371714 [Ornithodoros turicata]|uniref:uncharacterized protein LOC135371714 n=1 Tax=Ornithodoros turicata TaxID=34597 RepID=UPI003139A332
MSDATAATVASTFLSTWVARFGAPAVVTTDRGAQFEARLFAAFLQLLGTRRNRTTSYHPASNGMVERLHRQLKGAIMAHEDTAHWSSVLPVVLLGIRASVNSDLGCSAAELVYGTTLRLPADFFDVTEVSTPPGTYVDTLRRAFANVRPASPRVPSPRSSFVPQQLSSASHVFMRRDRIRRPLEQPYTGPHPVLRRSDKFFTISVDGKTETVSLDRFKPAFVEPPEPQ